MQNPLFTASEWDTLTKNVVTQMSQYVYPFTTPISKVISDDDGEHWGSGSYVEINGHCFVATNEHVVHALKTHSIAYKFSGDENYFRLPGHKSLAEGLPVDFALTKMNDSIWRAFPHQAKPIPISRFSTMHNPVEGELLFFLGYSQDRSRFAFKTLLTEGTPYLARECELPIDGRCDPEMHFALSYNPALAISVDELSKGLPLPPGFSGSLVWNTRFVEKMIRNESWGPADAVVTGIIWGWPSGTSLVATKVEYLPLLDMAKDFESSDD